MKEKRTRAYTRHQRERIIKKKLSILRNVLGYEEKYLPVAGKLNKGKIHCSCKMCRYEQFYGIPKAKHRSIINLEEERE
ncbi:MULTISPECIES: hypothetical protein [unclassified Sporosarcina]|uniref:hypothetical protein n=1 Tax=unclassified Sporosarcina TaxID=2647733 RepID=UPI00203CF031|nr:MULTISPECIES: hypothetical protein [unclassified Sporosarcina]GKV65626.1 hypothetical protein NCCP2331_17790 [Sporosarcina sp. NCCP-2331]GLB55794.1 hypothetical protein NCCP2378_15810 [Sporosarcina sp. NCCP-2378]